MLRLSNHSPSRVNAIRALRCVTVLFVALAGATLNPKAAWSADLRIPAKPDVKHESVTERQNRLFEEFLRFLKRQKQ
jgi:hypothetical protein